MSIVGAARVMLHDQGLPLHLWVEACNIVVYVQNCSPNRILESKAPEEAYSSKRPDVGHCRIFGSSVYCHVTKDARKKLELTLELGIFVGYTDTPHNYQVYMQTSWMTVAHRDVKFDEEKAMRVSFERELELNVEEELLVSKEAVWQLVWVDAMVEEYDSIVQNNVWDVVSIQEDNSVVSSRWLYKVKQAANGSVEKHKARFVARGFS
eukprot:PITA_02865